MKGQYKYAPGEWGTLAREYRRSLEADHKSPNTIRIYLGVVYQLGSWAASLDEPVDPYTITKSELRDYISKVLKETSAGNAHNRDQHGPSVSVRAHVEDSRRLVRSTSGEERTRHGSWQSRACRRCGRAGRDRPHQPARRCTRPGRGDRVSREPRRWTPCAVSAP
ncbi:hypothetical protein GCM10011581_18610 [Saccharopolyspora subtropica]|uniref:Core-binding (CB) domain-containing protein n=1 Tax=Saccharopolyspora thermophila TaxID=89367 RepID=A0A917JR77_9PSEU|nr:hypothetical protein GCM10011581_18610 [Saccharopolyspora subtropica]